MLPLILSSCFIASEWQTVLLQGIERRVSQKDNLKGLLHFIGSKLKSMHFIDILLSPFGGLSKLNHPSNAWYLLVFTEEKHLEIRHWKGTIFVFFYFSDAVLYRLFNQGSDCNAQYVRISRFKPLKRRRVFKESIQSTNHPIYAIHRRHQ